MSAALHCAAQKEMEDGIGDGFERVTAIIQGLAELEAPPKTYSVQDRKYERATVKKSAEALKTAKTAPAPAAWQGRHLGPFKRTTVFAAFDVSVDELSPSSFRVSIVSTEYCEEVQAKDTASKAVLCKRSLDDEKAFNIEISGHKLDEKIALSIAVLKDGNLNYAFMPLLDGTDATPKL